MFKYLIAASSILMLICFSNCNVLAPSPERIADYTLRAQYEQGVCFGRCPVYTLSLYENGLLLYQGERFTDKAGPWYRLLGQKETTAIIDSFARLNFASFPSTFPSNIPDLATRSLRFINDQGGDHKTTFKENANPDLKALADLMRSLADADGFRKYEGADPTIFGPTPDLAPQEVIVELIPGVTAAAWIVNYSKQNVQLKERISPNSNYYLITADPNIMDADELLEYLRADPEVQGAQLNRTVSPR